MAIKDNISLDEVEQVIDLGELLGRAPSSIEAREFSEIAINKVIERTQSGKDRNGKDFTAYSEDYADAKGVSPNDVDLTLMGDMLLSIDAEVQGNSVRMFIGGADVETKKAFNHHTGDTLPARPFFGLSEKEARDIAEAVRTNEPSIVEQVAIPSIFQQETEIDIDEVLRNIGLFVD